MKGILALAGLAFATATAAAAQSTLSPPPAFTPAMSQAIDRLASDEIAARRTPGLAIGVVEEGRVVYARGFGYANIGKKIRVDPDTEFYIGAATMPFTAGALLMLAADGKLKLDDRVVKYVPELTVAGDATVGQLLQQTSGLPDYRMAPGISLDPGRSIKVGELLAAVNKMRPSAPAGSAYAYNDLNYIVAGIVAERAGSVPLSDVLQQRIFLPLVMDHTFLAGDTGVSPSHATGYTYSPSMRAFVPARTWDPAWLLGAQGIITTVYDLAKWDIEMPILLRVDAVRTMFTPAGSAGPARYGMGWVIDRRGGKTFVWSNGEIAGYRSMNALIPEDHLAVIVLANTDSLHGGHVVAPEQVASQILDIVAPPATAHLDNAIVARAQEWLQRLAERQIDRTQLTTSFSHYLTDALVARENFAALGKLQTIVPISSTTEANGSTLYEFLVRYPHEQYHYKFSLTPDGKIDAIVLED